MFSFVKKIDLEQHSGNVENDEQYGIGLMRLCVCVQGFFFMGEVLTG